jgi:N-acetylmuramoyl-L-alanine amidase
MKYLQIVLGVILIACSPPTSSAQNKKVSKIVIDPGHGGAKPGARGTILNEKDLTLAVGLRVGKLINDSLRDVKIIFTRTTDADIPLADRHEIANQAGADLFVSIHVNSSPGSYEKVLTGHRTVGKGKKKKTIPVYRSIHHRETAAHGVETYVLGLKRNGQKEGAISEYSDNLTEPGTLNENDPQTAIIVAQYSQVFLNNSVILGQKIQNEFAAQGRKDLGVKQMSLEVLAGSVMPGVLVEIGFINNVEEEQYLNSEVGMNEVASAIFRGIRAYKREIEKAK